MELFIRIVDGQPFEHPMFIGNFCQAFPDVDVNNLPPEFARFERIDPPAVGVYEIYEGVTYEKNGEVYQDVHHVRSMTDAEKLAKQNLVRGAGAKYASWVFNETTCSFEAPTPRPVDGKIYRWDEPTTSWIEVTNV